MQSTNDINIPFCKSQGFTQLSQPQYLHGSLYLPELCVVRDPGAAWLRQTHKRVKLCILLIVSCKAVTQKGKHKLFDSILKLY